MATQKNSRGGSRSNRRSGGGFVPFLGGFIFALVVAAAVYWFLPQLLRRLRPAGRPAAAARSSDQPAEPAVLAPAPHPAAPHAVPEPPFGTSEDGFEAAAKVYAAQCAGCHGTPGHSGALARSLNPPAGQLWQRPPGSGVAGVAAEAPGRIYEQITDGMPHTGMPAYAHTLTTTERWQLALLLKNAGEVLPDPVLRLLQANDGTAR